MQLYKYWLKVSATVKHKVTLCNSCRRKKEKLSQNYDKTSTRIAVLCLWALSQHVTTERITNDTNVTMERENAKIYNW